MQRTQWVAEERQPRFLCVHVSLRVLCARTIRKHAQGAESWKGEILYPKCHFWWCGIGTQKGTGLFCFSMAMWCVPFNPTPCHSTGLWHLSLSKPCSLTLMYSPSSSGWTAFPWILSHGCHKPSGLRTHFYFLAFCLAFLSVFCWELTSWSPVPTAVSAVSLAMPFLLRKWYSKHLHLCCSGQTHERNN